MRTFETLMLTTAIATVGGTWTAIRHWRWRQRRRR